MGCVCVGLCLYIYTTSWAQKVKTCLAKGCCAAGLGLYIRFHMPCKFKSMTFPFSRKLPALLVPSTRRLTQCRQKEGMVQGTFATTAVLRFLPFGALWRLSLDWSQVLARSNATQQQTQIGFDQGLHTIKINIDLHRPETLTNPLCNHLTTCQVFLLLQLRKPEVPTLLLARPISNPKK